MGVLVGAYSWDTKSIFANYPNQCGVENGVANLSKVFGFFKAFQEQSPSSDKMEEEE